MFTVKTLNKISNVGLSKFDEAKYTIDDSAQSPDGLKGVNRKLQAP